MSTISTIVIRRGPAGADGAQGADGATGSTGPVGPAPSGTGFVKVSGGSLTTPSATIPHTDITGLGTAATEATDYFERNQRTRSRLWKWRTYLDSTGSAAPIALIGDSMIDTAKIVLRESLHREFGMGGYSFLPPHISGGASGVSLDFANWFTGGYARLSGSGHIATVNVDSTVPVEANTLKIYYVTQPSGGTFKIQTRRNLGSWTDEASYLTVSSNGTLTGSIISITKTEVRSNWDIRAVWVSGGNVDIIGGALYDTNSAGARLAMLAMGNTNLNQWVLASSAVCGPIIADIAPKLAIMSHLDGAALVVSHQATFQSLFEGWAATSPTWLVIGSPVGCTDVNDVASAAQVEAQITLANSRFDAFWDNRNWTGMTPAQAISAGFLVDATDPHLTTLAQKHWIPLMLEETQIARSPTRPASADLRPVHGAVMRRDRGTTTSTLGFASELQGSLRLTNPPGQTNFATLQLEDRSGAANSATDLAAIYYQSDLLYFQMAGGNVFTMTNSVGDFIFTGSGAADGSPVGYAGHMTAPLRGVVTSTLCVGYVEKTADYTLGTADHTVNVTANSVTITLPLSSNTGGTSTRNKGRIYIIANTGLGTVTMATTSSQLIDGASPATIAATGRLKIQSTGSGWITIP